MWNSSTEFQVTIKTEPKDFETDDFYHDSRSFEESSQNSDTEDCNYGNSSSLEDGPNSDRDGCTYNSRSSSAENNQNSDTEECKYGEMYLIKTNNEKNQSSDEPESEISEDKPLSSISHLPFYINKNNHGNKSSNFTKSDYLQFHENNKTDRCTDTPENVCKSRNRRKRKETVRRIKVQSSEICDIDLQNIKIEKDDENPEICQINLKCGGCSEIFVDALKYQAHIENCNQATHDVVSHTSKKLSTDQPKKGRKKNNILDRTETK